MTDPNRPAAFHIRNYHHVAAHDGVSGWGCQARRMMRSHRIVSTWLATGGVL